MIGNGTYGSHAVSANVKELEMMQWVEATSKPHSQDMLLL